MVAFNEKTGFFFVGQLHKDVPTEEHPGNLTILMSKHFNSNSL